MNKNRIMSLVLAGALLVGGTYVGTKAAFTSEDKIPQSITINTGTLKVNAEYEETWKIVNENSEAEMPQGSNDLQVVLNNAKPGDTISRNFYIENYGTLNLNGTVEVKDIDGLDVNVSYLGVTGGNPTISQEEGKNLFTIDNLAPKTDALFEIVITVPDLANDGQGITIADFTAEDFITVNAVQR